jgi:hypothetical protein
MNIPLCKPYTFKALPVLALLLVGSAHGQQPAKEAVKVQAEPPEASALLSPDFNTSTKKAYKPKEWVEVEAKMKILMVPEPKTKTCDQVTVKWYVAVEGPEKGGPVLMFSKDVEHVNVPVNEDIYFSIYLSPASLRRLEGEVRNPEKIVQHIGYEVLVNGTVVAKQTTSRAKLDWWTSSKVTKSDVITLLNKSETPFSHMWWDRYAEVSPERK